MLCAISVTFHCISVKVLKELFLRRNISSVLALNSRILNIDTAIKFYDLVEGKSFGKLKKTSISLSDYRN